MRKAALLALALLLPAAVEAQGTGPEASSGQQVVTNPYGLAPGTSGNASTTIQSGGTYQSLWAANNNRRGCTVQNNGSHTMYVFFGPIASATHALSVQLSAGQSVNCQYGGITLQDQVSIDGTTSDAFYAAQQ